MSLKQLSQELEGKKLTGWKLSVINICKHIMQTVVDALKSNQSEEEFKKTCDKLFSAALRVLREGEDSPSNLVKYFKQFRNTKSDEELELEFAEKLIWRAGSYQKAKDVITWIFTADVEEFKDSSKRPWRMHEAYAQYPIYVKYNDERELKRKKLLEEHYKKEK